MKQIEEFAMMIRRGDKIIARQRGDGERRGDLCALLAEALHLNGHEAMRWQTKNELESVKWLPADWDVVKSLKPVE